MEGMIREGYEITPESLMTYLNAWLNEYKRGTVAKNTFQLHKRNIEKHIIPYFKNI